MSTPYRPRIAVVIVAAGSGTRLGEPLPKALVPLDRHSVLWHSVHGACAALTAQLIVVAPPDRIETAQQDATAAAGDRADELTVLPGGATRQQSVQAGLNALADDIEIVLVHDAARALTPPDVFHRVVSAVATGADAVLPTLPVVDTIKRVEGGLVHGAVDRSQLAAAQTPQAFSRAALIDAYRAATAEFTDDAALVAASGHQVHTVDGHARAFKITTPDDLARARSLIGAADSPQRRVGVGTDVHAFGGEGELWLAGLCWPGQAPLSGHSDGDAAAHAIVDALLSAAGLGDIGGIFGTDRPDLAGAHADVFLAEVARMLTAHGWWIENVAVQVQSNRPRLSARRTEAEQALSRALGGAPVSVAGTTTDGLGFTGAGEGVAAYAVAAIARPGR